MEYSNDLNYYIDIYIDLRNNWKGHCYIFELREKLFGKFELNKNIKILDDENITTHIFLAHLKYNDFFEKISIIFKKILVISDEILEIFYDMIKYKTSL